METPRILVVDDESDNLKALERTLRGKYQVTSVEDPREALDLVEKEPFAVVISDHKMPGMLGTELLSEVAKKSPLTTRILLTAYTEREVLLAAINRAEIYRFLSKPWENTELTGAVDQGVERWRLVTENRRLVDELKKMNEGLEKTVADRTADLREVNEKLSHLAMTDPLTKILNRRALFARFAEEIERSRRYAHNFVVVMIDVDHFKEFNDMEGHLRGDEALKRIAATLMSSLRRTDLVGRYGGEEFMLVMTETVLPNAVEICERLRATIEDTEFQGKDETAFLTCSFGLATYPDAGNTIEALTETADQALYQAKQSGRNRVVY